MFFFGISFGAGSMSCSVFHMAYGKRHHSFLFPFDVETFGHLRKRLILFVDWITTIRSNNHMLSSDCSCCTLRCSGLLIDSMNASADFPSFLDIHERLRFAEGVG